MSKLKKVLIWIFAVSCLLAGAATILGYIYQDEILLKSTKQLNAYLNTEIVPEKMEVSFIKKFPYASVELQNVIAYESWDQSNKDTLFQFEAVYLKFNLLDLYNGVYNLEAAEFSNGKAHFKTAATGAINYDFWKTTNSNDSTQSNFTLSLKKVNFNEVEYIWERAAEKERIHVQINRAVTRGDFSSTAFQMDVDGVFDIRTLQFDQMHLLAGQQLDLDVGFQVNLEENLYQLYRGNITLDNTLNLSVTGNIASESYQFDLSGEDIALNQALSILPVAQQKQLEDWSFSGSSDLSIHLEQKQNENTPLIQANFNLRNADLSQNNGKGAIQGIKANGNYTNGSKRNASTSRIRLNAFSAKKNETEIKGELDLLNFDQTRLKAQFECKGVLEDLHELISIDTLSNVRGAIQTECAIQLELNNLFASESTTIGEFSTAGFFQISDTQFELKESPLKVEEMHAEGRLENEVLDLDSLSGLLFGSQISFNGTIQNVFSWNSQKPSNIVGNIQVDAFNYENWEVLSNHSNDDSTAEWPEQFTVDARLMLGHFQKEKITADSITTRVVYKHGMLDFNPLRVSMLEGQSAARLSIENKNDKTLFTSAGKLTNLNIEKAFRMFDNFGQESITANHVKGKVSADYVLKFSMFNGEVEQDQIDFTTDLIIAKGELNQYKPLLETVAPIESNKVLNLLVNLEDFKQRLNHIKFDRLSNTLAIKNQKLTIPRMQITSSALNIELSGSHTFKNEIDYALNFNLKEVLVKDKNLKVNDYGYIKDDNLGNKQIFLKIGGTIDQPEISLDKSAARSYRKEITQQEVNTTKAVLKDEFGLFKNDTTLRELEEPSEAEYRMDFGEFDTTKENASTPGNSPSDTTENDSKLKRFFKGLKDPKNEKRSKFEEWEFKEDDL